MKLLLLSACFCVGFSFEFYWKKEYGSIFNTELSGWIYYIEFIPKSGSNATMLWSRDAPDANFDDRRRTEGSAFIIYNLTQRDSGLYLMKDFHNEPRSKRTVEVVAKTQKFNLQYFDSLSFATDLDPSLCNIYFLPEGGQEVEIVQRGQLQDPKESKCKGFTLLEPCGVEKTFYGSCVGQFEVRDNNDDHAMVVLVEKRPFSQALIWSSAAFGCTVLSCLLSVCCCKLKKNGEQATDEEEPGTHNKSDPESVALQSNQVSVPSN